MGKMKWLFQDQPLGAVRINQSCLDLHGPAQTLIACATPGLQFVIIIVSNNVMINVNIGDNNDSNNITVLCSQWLIPGKGQSSATNSILCNPLNSPKR